MEPIENVRKSKEYKARKEAGVDVEALIQSAMETERYKKYKSPATRESILMSAIIPLREPPKGEDFDEELVVFSSHDRYGTKAPTKFVALRKNKTFCNIVMWDADSIKAPCKLRLVGKSNTSEYGTDIQPIEGGISAVMPMEFGELQSILNKVAITTKQWDKLENLVEGVKSDTRAFRSTIGGIRATDVWGAKSAETGKSSRVGKLPVLSTDERAPSRLHPSMQIKLDYTGGYEVYANLNQQHYGSPIYRIEDFNELCIDAIDEYPDDKDKQIEFVRSGIMGRDVYLIMDVFGNKAGREDKRYITGSCSFIMEVIPDATQGTLQVDEEPTSQSSSGNTGNTFVDDLVEACAILNQDPLYVPVAKAREIASIGADVSDAMVQEMTKRASQLWNEKKKAA